MQELLRVHETIFWIDSSVRMQTSNLEPVYQQALNMSRGVVTFDDSGHNIFMATHAKMYRYLPISKDSAIKVQVYGAGVLFVSRSKQVRNIFFICFVIVTMNLYRLSHADFYTADCITESYNSKCYYFLLFSIRYLGLQ